MRTYIEQVAETVRENRGFFMIYFPVALLIGLLLIFFPKEDLFLTINSFHGPIADAFFPLATYLGDGIFYAGIVVVLLFVSYRYALIGALSFLVSGLAAQALKKLVFTDWYRPIKYFGEQVDFHTIAGVDLPGNFSFPSGHTTSAFSLFLLLALLTRNKNWGAIFCIIGFVAGYSRVYLAVHFPEDVLAGSALGIVSTLLIFSWIATLKLGDWGAKSLRNLIR